MRMARPGAAHPRGVREVPLLQLVALGYLLNPVPGVDPTSPAMRCQRRGAIPAWGRGCSPSLDVPRRVQKPGLRRLQPPRSPSPLAPSFWLLLPAGAQLWMAEDGTASQMQRQICFPNSSWVPEPGNGDAALI